MFKTLSLTDAKAVVGGNDYHFKCWTKKGKEYWDTRPNKAGCIDSRSGNKVYGSAAQRKK